MKNYLPEAKNDSIFAFVGNAYILIGIILAGLVTLIVVMMQRKKKKHRD